MAKHNSSKSCWVVLYGNVYDVGITQETPTRIQLQTALTDTSFKVTDFLPSHPGGAGIILKLAGRDATDEYDPIHPPGTLDENLAPEALLGTVDPETLPKKEDLKDDDKKDSKSDSKEESLSSLLNLDDIERVATRRLSQNAWGYYYSASDDLASKALNTTAYRGILLRPRVFLDCSRCDLSVPRPFVPSGSGSGSGPRLKLPIYVSPAAMARLAHTAGEAGIAAACATFGAMQIISANASMRPEDIVAQAEGTDQVFGWQLYVQTDRRKSEAMLARINRLANVKFVCLTLDAPVPGKREHDERNKAAPPAADDGMVQAAGGTQSGSGGGGAGAGIGQQLFAGTAADLTWQVTLPWLAQHTHLPIVLKGVQTHEDAYIASLHAPQVCGVILSNHGGRALDTAPPAVHTLLEIRKYCPAVFRTLDVSVDGGIRRGTDVVKALCLGARAVGIGRAPLFGLAAGGPQGVERVLQSMFLLLSTYFLSTE